VPTPRPALLLDAAGYRTLTEAQAAALDLSAAVLLAAPGAVAGGWSGGAGADASVDAFLRWRVALAAERLAVSKALLLLRTAEEAAGQPLSGVECVAEADAPLLAEPVAQLAAADPALAPAVRMQATVAAGGSGKVLALRKRVVSLVGTVNSTVADELRRLIETLARARQ
jgi:hypothetical protein